MLRGLKYFLDAAKVSLVVCFLALVLVTAFSWLSNLFVPDVEEARDPARDLQHGEYLLHVAGCVGCHTDTDNGGPFLAGGRRLETPFGVFHVPNITPDVETGIGGWALKDFIRSMRRGADPVGRPYYPAFPYTSYAKMTQTDMRALYAYLRSVPAVRRETPRHETVWYVSRLFMPIWKTLFFDGDEYRHDSDRDEDWNRGAYLAQAVGHCAECHSPRNALGGLRQASHLTGNEHGPDGDNVPDITASPEHGIGDWTQGDLLYFLETGMLPDGDFTGGAMADVIDNSTSRLTREDRQALAHYLRTVPSAQDKPERK